MFSVFDIHKHTVTRVSVTSLISSETFQFEVSQLSLKLENSPSLFLLIFSLLSHPLCLNFDTLTLTLHLSRFLSLSPLLLSSGELLTRHA